MVRQIDIVLAYCIQVSRRFRVIIIKQIKVTIFGAVPSWMEVAGASLIMMTVISIPWEESIDSILTCSTTEDDQSLAASLIEEQGDSDSEA